MVAMSLASCHFISTKGNLHVVIIKCQFSITVHLTWDWDWCIPSSPETHSEFIRVDIQEVAGPRSTLGVNSPVTLTFGG